MKKLVAVVTGSRAEFGLMKSLLEKIENSTTLDLDLIVTGSHLSKQHGYTIQEILNAGFNQYTVIDLDLNTESETKVAFAVSNAIKKFAIHFQKTQPSIVIVLGDRYEIFGVVVACAIQGIPIGHIHGGEVTEGSKDELYRHSITKLSSIHFVANWSFKKRIMRLGEQPDRIHVVGGLGVDAVYRTRLLNKIELEKKLGLTLDKKIALVTFHPDTVNPKDTTIQANVLLLTIAEYTDINFIITGSNADYQGTKMNKIFKEACEKFPNLFFLNSIGQENYLSLVSISIFIIGNSSSGLLEAPSLRIPTINVGSRQDGRPKAQSVIDVDCTKTSIRSGIQKALSKEFLKSMNDVENPYGPPGASQKIFNILELMDFSQSFQKKFYDGTEGDENHS